MPEEFRRAIRTYLKTPTFTAMAILTLAVAIGANTAIFSVVKSVILNPLPFDDAERLVGVWHSAPGLGFEELNSSPSTYFTYRDEGRMFEDQALWRDESITLTGRGEPERLDILRFTDGMLPILRVKTHIGRGFSRTDDLPSSPLTVLLSYSYWQRKFGGDPEILGQTLLLDGAQCEVIGVLPLGFRFLNENPDLILPMRIDRSKVFVGEFNSQGIARLKPGATLAQANADVARMLPLMIEKFPLPHGFSREMLDSARIGSNVRPLKKDAVGSVGGMLWILMGTAGVVLLIACANVANLLLVRGEGRRKELAIRVALGADWRRIARQLLLESLALALAAGALGVPLAYASFRVLVSMKPTHIPRLNEISIDPGVLLFALGVSLLTGLLFGLLPAVKFAAPRIAQSLHDGSRGSSAGRERHRARNALVVTQVALALVLLVSSGLLLRTFQELRKVQPGFVKPEDVMTIRLSIPEAQVPEPANVIRMQRQIIENIRQIPGVTDVSFVSDITMDGSNHNDPVFVEQFPEQQGKLPPLRRYKFVAPEYFRTMGNPILAGRDYTWEDIVNIRDVAIVSESFAKTYWPNPADAVGKRIKESPKSPWREIIGVAGNERDNGLDKPASITVYWPTILAKFWDQFMYHRRSTAFLIRSGRTRTPGLLKDVQNAVWAVNPGLPTANVRTLAYIRDRSMMRTSFTMLMLIVAGGVALLLGVVGLYGVISYAVSQRTREIGIRMALGARHDEVSRMFVAQGMKLTIAGIAIGAAAAAGATRLLSAMLFGVSAIDPLTYLAVALALAASAALACYLPARHATRVDPARALRSE
jgi:predicted permease